MSESLTITASLVNTTLGTSSLGGVLLLTDDQSVGWLSPSDPRYGVGVKLCQLRDHFQAQSESKAVPGLQKAIQQTLFHSRIEVLLWLGKDEEDPSVPLTETARGLWQAPKWQAFRPGDPPPSTWLPLQVAPQKGDFALIYPSPSAPDGNRRFYRSTVA